MWNEEYNKKMKEKADPNYNGPVNWCTGYDPPRYVRFAVCKWHLEQEDPKCKSCMVKKRKEAGIRDG